MALAGSGAIVIWNGIGPELREDFFEWHPREHMVERLGIPGFLRGRRCIAMDGATEFLTLYELQTPEVLLTEAYRSRLTQPTPWSAKVLPGFTDNTRGACRVLCSAGPAMGGFVLSLRLTAAAQAAPGLLDHLCRLLPDMATLSRVTGAHLLRNDVALTGNNAGQQRGRMIHLPDMVLLLEGSDAQALKDHGERMLSDSALVQAGAEPGVVRGLYQLEYSIQSLAH